MYNTIIEKPDLCCGCGACVSVCPKQCLHLKQDERGFRIVEFEDKEKCISCGLCSKVCQLQGEKGSVSDKPYISRYYAQIKNREILSESSSGGVFSALAYSIIKEGGVVWGVRMRSNGTATFYCAEDRQSVGLLRGSKYVEVAEPIPFDEIKRQLNEGRKVLFSGVPCQIKALKKYLGEWENLITVDLLCYGIQSPNVWKKYLSEINHEEKPICNVWFRHKNPRWEDYSIKVEFSDGSTYEQSRWKDPYLLSYATNLYNRDSCTVCTAKKFPRPGDITLGDFWQIDTIPMLPNDLKVNAGVSVVICNTKIGRKLLEKAKWVMNLYEIPESVFPNMVSRYSGCSSKNPKRAEFESLLDSCSFKKAVQKTVGCQADKRLRFQWLRLKRVLKKMKGKIKH